MNELAKWIDEELRRWGMKADRDPDGSSPYWAGYWDAMIAVQAEIARRIREALPDPADPADPYNVRDELSFGPEIGPDSNVALGERYPVADEYPIAAGHNREDDPTAMGTIEDTMGEIDGVERTVTVIDDGEEYL